MIIYPLYLFDNKWIKIVGVVISSILIILVTINCLLNPPVYDTHIMSNTEEHPFDDTYKVTIGNSEYGELEIVKHEVEYGYGDGPEVFYCVQAKFTKTGKTDITIESPEGEKKVWDIEIKKNTYDIEERKDQD